MDGRMSFGIEGTFTGRQFVRLRSGEHKVIFKHAKAGTCTRCQHKSRFDWTKRFPFATHLQEIERKGTKRSPAVNYSEGSDFSPFYLNCRQQIAYSKHTLTSKIYRWSNRNWNSFKVGRVCPNTVSHCSSSNSTATKKRSCWALRTIASCEWTCITATIWRRGDTIRWRYTGHIPFD